MGLGKTLQVIKACELEIFDRKIATILIFCPNSLIKNWSTELKKWLPLASSTGYVKGQLLECISNYTFVITPYSQLRNFVTEFEPLVGKFDSIAVFDEAHKLRNEGANVSKYSKILRIKKKWLLTGTPLERDEKDIETILRILDPGSAVSNLKPN